MRAPSLKATDFQRALGSRPVSRTAHFVLHVLPVVPTLSTGGSVPDASPVDECDGAVDLGAVPDTVRPGWRFGLVLPKKQARRSVTRSLLRHQVRESLRRHAQAVRRLPAYDQGVDGWVLRLKAPFDRQLFPSAASRALSMAVRAELDVLWGQLLRPRRPSSPTTPPGASARDGAAA